MFDTLPLRSCYEWLSDYDYANNICNQAADEIERLRKKNEFLLLHIDNLTARTISTADSGGYDPEIVRPEQLKADRPGGNDGMFNLS